MIEKSTAARKMNIVSARGCVVHFEDVGYESLCVCVCVVRRGCADLTLTCATKLIPFLIAKPIQQQDDMRKILWLIKWRSRTWQEPVSERGSSRCVQREPGVAQPSHIKTDFLSIENPLVQWWKSFHNLLKILQQGIFLNEISENDIRIFYHCAKIFSLFSKVCLKNFTFTDPYLFWNTDFCEVDDIYA